MKMKISREKCVFALQRLYSLTNGVHNLYPMSVMGFVEKDISILEELIDEHFDSKNTKVRLVCVTLESDGVIELKGYKCPVCGTVIEDVSSKFCKECGQGFEEWI